MKYLKYFIIWAIGIMTIDIIMFAPIIWFLKLDFYYPPVWFVLFTISILTIWTGIMIYKLVTQSINKASQEERK